MNKHLLLLISILFPALAFSQVIVGTGTNESQAIPIEAYYGYSYSQTVYLASEIGSSGTITSLSYYYSGFSSLPNSDDDIQIYMSESTRTSFASGTDWEPVASMTMVFSGSFPAPTTPGVDEWLTVTLTTPFSYSGTDNLIVGVDANEAGYDSSSDDFHCSPSSTGRSIYYRSDSTNPNPASPPFGSTISYIANITLGGLVPSAVPNCSENNIPADGATDLAFECGAAVMLSWDPASGGAAPDMYDVYFGTTMTPPLVSSTSMTTYAAESLSASTTYYYKIVPKAGVEEATGCDVLSFTTGTENNDAGSGGLNDVYYFANNNNSDGTAGGAFLWDDPVAFGHTQVTTMTSGSLDDGYSTVTLPFTYTYYGVEYTDMHIGTNGYVSFGAGYTTTGSSTDLGSTSTPNGMIAVAMMDLDDESDGKIFHGIIDDITYAVTWYHYHDYGDASEYITMQLILQDLPGTDNDVFEIRFNQDESTAIPDILNDAVIGCEDLSANATTEFARYREDGVGGPMFCSPLVIGFAPTEEGVLLPLDLLSFEGTKLDKSNLLTWTTANEVNTDFFEVQSSKDGINWRAIGKVDAAGISTSTERYSYEDVEPFTTSYYRLKMNDLDGTFEFSEVLSIRREVGSGILNIFPNPASDHLTVNFDMSEEALLEYSIRDINGRLIKTKNIESVAGSNQLRIETADLIQGIYFIQFQSNTLQDIRRVVIR